MGMERAIKCADDPWALMNHLGIPEMFNTDEDKDDEDATAVF